MKNKVRFLIAILMLSCLFNLHAQINLDEDYQKNNYPQGIFEIRAYKNNPDPILITLYDALTTALAEIPDNARIDLYPHLRGFVLDQPEAVDKKNAVFSFFISGSRNAAFTLTISPQPFIYKEITGYTEDVKPQPIIVEHKIDSVYKLVDSKFYFSKTKKGTDSLGDNTISMTNSIEGPIHTVNTETGDSIANSLVCSWKIDPLGAKPSKDFWVVEGVVVLGIQKTGDYGYDKAKSGLYEATVTIELKSIN